MINNFWSVQKVITGYNLLYKLWLHIEMNKMVYMAGSKDGTSHNFSKRDKEEFQCHTARD